jgi:hypothetical protein
MKRTENGTGKWKGVPGRTGSPGHRETPDYDILAGTQQKVRARGFCDQRECNSQHLICVTACENVDPSDWRTNKRAAVGEMHPSGIFQLYFIIIYAI